MYLDFIKLLLFLFFSNQLCAQVPLDTIILKNGHKDTLRILGTDGSLVYYMKGEKSNKVPLDVVKTINYGYDFSLDINEEKQTVKFEKIFNDLAKSKNDLYLFSREWMVDAFVDSREVIKLEDKEGGVIIGKGIYKLPEILHFTIKIFVKDNRMKFVLEEFQFSSSYSVSSQLKFDVSTWLWKNTGKRRNRYDLRRYQLESSCKKILFSLLNRIEDSTQNGIDNW